MYRTFDTLNIFVGFSTPGHLKSFCNDSTCPSDLISDAEAFRVQCCIWHANIHVCHPTASCGMTVSNK